jgi:hypothetical protein
MPRLPNVKMDELEDLIDAMSVDASRMNDMARRISQGYCDAPADILAKIGAINGIIGAAAELAGALILKQRIADTKAQ